MDTVPIVTIINEFVEHRSRTRKLMVRPSWKNL